MTDIRELLREATADVTVERSDPVQQVRRAVTRRLRTAAAVGLAVIAVAAAIIVPLSLSTGSSTKGAAPPTPSTTSVVHWNETNAGGVAAGFGSIWVLKCCGGSTAPSWVDRLNPGSGTRLSRIAVPGPAAQIAAGAGYVWTVGATDGGRSAITAIDPDTAHRWSLKLPNPQSEPVDIAFSRGYAWVTFHLLNQVWRLRPNVSPTGAGPVFDRRIIPVPGGPYDVTTTGSGQLWVQSLNTSTLRRLVPTRRGAHVGERVSWAGHIYSPATGSSLWASTAGYDDIVQLTPSALARCSACAQSFNRHINGQQIDDALSTPRGLFVSTYGGSGRLGHVDFFATAALSAAREAPTATVAGYGALAADGDGVVVGSDNGLIHWIPAE